MKQPQTFLVLFLSIILFTSSGLAVLKIDDATLDFLAKSSLDITTYLETRVEDPDARDFRGFNYHAQLQPDLKLPYTSNALWVRLVMENSSTKAIDLYLHWSTALGGKIELYDENPEIPLQQSGSMIPFEKKKLTNSSADV